MESQKRKKVLIITYYWPPAGGPGVQRVLKFAKYLPEFGWDPIVLTVANGEYPAIDTSLLKEINPKIKIVKTKTIEFFQLFKFFSQKKKGENIDTFILDKKKFNLKDKIFTWIRSNLFIPDARIGWSTFAVKAGLKIIRDEGIDLMISSSPPATVQVIANQINKKTGVKWIADFRDPWVDAFWEDSINRIPIFQKKFENQEKAVFDSADFFVTATNSFKELFTKKYNLSNIETITNGYDLNDFNKKPNAKYTPFHKFRISYTGSIAESQNPIKFFKSIKNLPSELKSDLIVDLYGAIDTSVIQAIDDHSLNEEVSYHGYISHDQVVEVMSSSNLLILLIPENRGDIIPGKLFEYMASGNTILSLGPRGDASKIILENNFGNHFDFDEDCSQFLIDEISKWKRNPKSQKKTPPKLYSRRNLTKRLACIMDNVLT